ncbi:2-phosphoxylose phosphatase 1 [Holothuria leucospilota]|uniref:2-phosphoxylose phosphatase 1 n=1 Tax=Holothuria leucospilota TaxID=206669 RepID=A0A9Q0YLD0_HOLLE|nr:2-phosphoxylose phosphatase 1 [Holothuria leucospilota]
MFISKKRSVICLLLILLASVWIVFQNISLYKSIFKFKRIREDVAQMSRLHALKNRVNAKQGGLDFQPPPRFEGEEPSDGYTVEDMYFRRWQVAHNVEPVRKSREKTGEDRKWKGWAAHHNTNSRLQANFEAMKQRQEYHMQHVEALKRQHFAELEKRSDVDEDSEDNDGNTGTADDMSSSYTITRTWLKERLANYCRFKDPTIGDEGAGPEEYSLKSVYVFARHGDRTPIENGKTGKLAPFKWECSLTEANKKIGSLHMTRFLKLMNLHLKDVNTMDPELRSTIQRIPLREWSIGCYSSQLTPQGWIQHMRLGDFMKKRYWHALQLGSVDPMNSHKISIKSTATQRTIQSAIAFMFAFLPSFKLEDIAKIRIAENPTFCMERHCLCGAAESLKDRVAAQYTALRKEKNTTLLSKSVSKYMYIKDPLYSIPNPSRLVELLTARSCHGSALPCTKKGCVDEEMFERVFKTVDSINSQVRATKNSSAKLYGRLAMHPVLTSISTTIGYIDKGQARLPRFYLNMGHDITLIPLLDALGLTYPWPGYASRLVFEHWHHITNDLSGLKIIYNGVDVTHRVRFCQNLQENNGLCPYEAFRQFMNSENLRVFDAATYEEACMWNMD